MSAQVALVMEQKERLTESERDREHGSDGDSGICVGRQKSQPPILGGAMLTTYLGSLSRAVLESREGLKLSHSG